MPVEFLSSVQRRAYGRYAGDPGADELDRYFHLDDADRGLIGTKRGDHNRLGFALQLATVRFLGRFLEDPVQVPVVAVQTIARQLQISDLDQLARYATSDQRWQHAAEIRLQYGYREWSDPEVGFRLGRWLFALCWTGTDQPGVLFDRTSTWLLSHKVILPGGTTVERFVARLRARVEERLWRKLGRGITEEQRARLDELLLVPELGGRASLLDRLRSGPVRVSGRALVQAIMRLQRVRDLDIKLPAATVPPSRIASLARFASSAKVTAIARLSPPRRLATLVAFVHRLEATALDDVIEVFDMLLHELFGAAGKADKKARLRSIKDLDQSGRHFGRRLPRAARPESFWRPTRRGLLPDPARGTDRSARQRRAPSPPARRRLLPRARCPLEGGAPVLADATAVHPLRREPCGQAGDGEPGMVAVARDAARSRQPSTEGRDCQSLAAPCGS